MPELSDLVPLLKGYPGWVRFLVFVYFVCGVAGYGALVLFAPPARFMLDAVRLAGGVAAGKPLVLDVLARNPMAERVQITELHLSFHAGEPPSGGLQGFESASATYQVSPLEGGKQLTVRNADQFLSSTTSIVYPYAGQDFAEVSVPIAQSIERDGTDRFRIELSAPNIPKPGQRFVDVVAVYNGDKETKAARVAIPRD